jgi:hypothetical protein
MTPPTCPLCHRRASERVYRGDLTGLVDCLSPFHDAGDWGPALLEALKDAAEFLHLAQGNHTVDWATADRVDDLLAAVGGHEEGK